MYVYIYTRILQKCITRYIYKLSPPPTFEITARPLHIEDDLTDRSHSEKEFLCKNRNNTHIDMIGPIFKTGLSWKSIIRVLTKELKSVSLCCIVQVTKVNQSW